MVQRETILYVADNSGAKVVKCIKVFKSLFGVAGFVIVAAVKKSLLRKRIRKGMVCRAVIVRDAVTSVRLGGYSVRFLKNYVVVLKKNENVPLGTRVIGSVSYSLRFYGYLRIVSLATTVV
jgi:large subunit ribosomal protein L14